jgi:hypothetical protein
MSSALTIHDRHFGVVTRSSASAWVPELVAAAGRRATDAYTVGLSKLAPNSAGNYSVRALAGFIIQTQPSTRHTRPRLLT